MTKTKLTTLVLSVIMVLALCIGIFPAFRIETHAESDAEVIDSSEWTYPTDSVTPTWTGEGTEANPYMISTTQQLADLAYLVNTADISSAETCYAGVHFKLANSLDLNPGFTATKDGFTGEGMPKEWTPIGFVEQNVSVAVPFLGVFDGNGYTIYGVYLGASSCAGESTGLFEYVDIYSSEYPSGVKNLNINNSYAGIDNDEDSIGHCAAVGLLVGLNCSTVDNCHVNGYVNVNDSRGRGWIIGISGVVGQNNSNNSKVVNSSFSGEVNYTGAYLNKTGGIVAFNSGYVENCVNYGKIVSDSDKVGGIVGVNANYDTTENAEYPDAGTVKGCKNYGDVYADFTVGGIVGHSSWGYAPSYSNSKILDCINLGNVVCNKDMNVGGVVGYMGWADVENCHNLASVSNKTNPATVEQTGALAGQVYEKCTLKNSTYCQNDTVNNGLLAAAYVRDTATDFVLENVSAVASPHKGVKQNGQAADCINDGWKDYYQCDYCEKYYSELTCENEISDIDTWKTGEGKIEAFGHSHSVEWSKNDTHHWHECTCGDKADEAEHTYGEWTVTNEATENEKGSKTKYCVCGKTLTEEIPATGVSNGALDSEPTADNDGLSGGEIAGIIIGAVAVLGGGGFAIYWFILKKKRV